MKTYTKIFIVLGLALFGLLGGRFVFDHVELNHADALVSYPPAALLQPGDITSSMILDGTIVAADASANAAFNLSQMASGTAGTLVGYTGTTLVSVTSGDGPVFTNIFALPGANSNITSLSGLSTPLTSVQGGTGAALNGALQGALPYFSSTGVMSALGTGTSGQFLKTQGAGANPVWANVSITTKAIQFTRNSNDVDGTITYAHGMGVVPNFVEITCMGASSGKQSFGTYNGTNNKVVDQVGGASEADTTNCVVFGSTSASADRGVCSWDSTNLSITYTLGPSPNAGLFNCMAVFR